MLTPHEQILVRVLLGNDLVEIHQLQKCIDLAQKSGKTGGLCTILLQQRCIEPNKLFHLVKTVQQKMLVCHNCQNFFLSETPLDACSKCGDKLMPYSSQSATAPSQQSESVPQQDFDTAETIIGPSVEPIETVVDVYAAEIGTSIDHMPTLDSYDPTEASAGSPIDGMKTVDSYAPTQMDMRLAIEQMETIADSYNHPTETEEDSDTDDIRTLDSYAPIGQMKTITDNYNPAETRKDSSIDDIRTLDSYAPVTEQTNISIGQIKTVSDNYDLIETGARPAKHNANQQTRSSLPANQQRPQQDSGRYFGNYRLIRELGRGGAGVVYEVLDVTTNTRYALKCCQQDQQSSLKRFQREGQAMAQLNHPNIVKLKEANVVGQNFYLVMDLIEGWTLAKIMKKIRLPYRIALTLVQKLAEVLQYVHDYGLIHRDLKPDNIMINKHFEPILMDFGITKVTEDAEKLTASGLIMGTPNYLSPEQAMGMSNKLDHRSDIYSLGAILYELLTGEFVIGHCKNIRTVIVAVMSKTPKPPGEVVANIPNQVDDICLRALAKKPDERFQNAGEMAAAISQFLGPIPPISQQLRQILVRKQ